MKYNRFTPRQICGIISSLYEKLSLIVGPPGTGKTDVLVEICRLLLTNYPNQRILLVTHSNAALNDIFEKILAKGIEGRYLLRLGYGESSLKLETLDRFTKEGRINAMLEV